MILFCTGPDTFRAVQKAKELEAAFRAKFDPNGYATVVDPSLSIEALAAQIGTTSLFAPRKCFRRDGLAERATEAQWKVLRKQLEGNQEDIVIISVEPESIRATVQKQLEGMKVVQYSFPLLTATEFLDWCVSRAREVSVTEARGAEIARRTNGDLWLAAQELAKCAVYAEAPLVEKDAEEVKIFEIADRWMRGSSWRKDLQGLDASPLAVFASQARAAVKVGYGVMNGVPPFLQKKFQAMPQRQSATKLQTILTAQIAQRVYLGTEEEIEILY